MDFLPPDAHHRIVFFRLGAPTPVAAVAAEVSRLLEAARGWGMPYQMFAAYDAAFRVVAIDRDETLVELLRASAVDWLGDRPAGAPTHRFGAFNRREDAEFADIYLCFRAEGDAANPGAGPPRDVVFYGEVRFGVGSATGPDALQRRFEDVLAVFSPTHAFVETAYQKPRAISETKAPHVGWATFSPERLGPPPSFESPTVVAPAHGGSIVVATPGAFDDDDARAAIRATVAWNLRPFLEAGVQVTQPYVEPRPPEPKVSVPQYLLTPAPPPAVEPVTMQAAPSPGSPGAAAPRPRIEAGDVPCFVLHGGADPRARPLRAAAVMWSMGGASYVTGLAKITFVLQTGWLSLTAPEPILEKDRFYRQSTLHSLEDHSDMIPFLPRGEAFVRGTAVVQGGLVTRVRLLVQEAMGQGVVLDKLLDLRGDLDPGGPDLVSVPLRYELAVHDELLNPAGVRAGAKIPPTILHPKAEGLAVGFGSLSPYWPVRADRLKPHEKQAWSRSPIDLPPNFPWDAYSAAPPDQRIQGFFQGTERIYLEGFHTRHRVIDAALPGVLAGGHVYFRNGLSSPVPMVADTVRVDLDQWLVSVTFRGYVPSPSPEPTDVVFGAALLAPHAPPPVWPEHVAFPYSPESPPPDAQTTQTGGLVKLPGPRGGLPFIPANDKKRRD